MPYLLQAHAFVMITDGETNNINVAIVLYVVIVYGMRCWPWRWDQKILLVYNQILSIYSVFFNIWQMIRIVLTRLIFHFDKSHGACPSIPHRIWKMTTSAAISLLKCCKINQNIFSKFGICVCMCFQLSTTCTTAQIKIISKDHVLKTNTPKRFNSVQLSVGFVKQQNHILKMIAVLSLMMNISNDISEMSEEWN